MKHLVYLNIIVLDVNFITIGKLFTLRTLQFYKMKRKLQSRFKLLYFLR
jgi:hypothetical protein